MTRTQAKILRFLIGNKGSTLDKGKIRRSVGVKNIDVCLAELVDAELVSEDAGCYWATELGEAHGGE